MSYTPSDPNSPYGQPQNPPNPPYGQSQNPSNPSYGQPQNPPQYGQPQNPSYDQMQGQPPPYGQSQQPYNQPYYNMAPPPKQGGFPVWTLLIIIPLLLIFTCGIISFILLNSAKDAVVSIASTAERQVTKVAMPGTVGSATQVAPISRVLATTPARTFNYANLQFSVTKGEITNKVSTTSDYYRADYANANLTLNITNQTKDSINLRSALFTLTLNGKDYTAPTDFGINSRDTQDYKLSFKVPTTATWDKATLKLDEEIEGGRTEQVAVALDGAANATNATTKVTISGQADIKEPKHTYKISDGEYGLDAFGSRALAGKRYLILNVNVSGADKYGVFVGRDNFRIIINGTPMAATSMSPVAEAVYANESKDFKVVFLIPAGTTSAQLEVGEAGKETARIPLTIPSS